MICINCKIEKEETEFLFRNKAKGVRHHICKTCKNLLYQKAWYQRHRTEHVARTSRRRNTWKKLVREFLVEFYKTHPCESCGFSNPAALEFHHKDPKLKKIEVSRMINGSYSLEYAQKEIDKCSVLCANCHRILTSKEYGWFKVRK